MKVVSNYLFDEIEQGYYKCRLNIFSNTDYMVLGNKFMQGYYTVFDIDHSKLGFGPLITSEKVNSDSLIEPDAN